MKQNPIRTAIVLSFIIFLLPYAGHASIQAERIFASSHAALNDSLQRPGSIKLGIKRYRRDDAQPVLLIHGLAQNDRFYDSQFEQYSFAKLLWNAGYDVWIGNLRGVGTEGVRSEAPTGPIRFTIDDYAVHDVPALVETVQSVTGLKPFIIGHSLAAWAIEGYLSGVRHDANGIIFNDSNISNIRQNSILGVITLGGVYNLWWEKSVWNALEDPIKSEDDYYSSNYELEALSYSDLLTSAVTQIETLPFTWLSNIVHLPLSRIPRIGDKLARAYGRLWNKIADTPVLNMFYYAPNCAENLVRMHAVDGLEDIPTTLLEQLRNAHTEKANYTYYHIKRPSTAYWYGQTRPLLRVPMFFIAGTRDRLANEAMIYKDGFLPYGGKDKQIVTVKAGHLDIVNGYTMPNEVARPVIQWMAARSPVARY